MAEKARKKAMQEEGDAGRSGAVEKGTLKRAQREEVEESTEGGGGRETGEEDWRRETGEGGDSTRG
jgi:hypothetical protein